MPSDSVPPELSPTDQIAFLNFHRPRLKSGDYRLAIKQIVNDLTTNVTQSFSVSGRRFSLDSTDIHLVYPPPHSQGDYHLTLPHIIFNSSTLPWERTPRGDDQDEILAPTWLALLVFTQEEAQAIQPRTCTVKELKPPSAIDKPPLPWLWPGIHEEISQHDEDGLTVIGVPWQLLKTQLPTYQDLYSLAHVRTIAYTSTNTGKTPNTPTEAEVSVVVAARLPPSQASCVVHLVSLEQRYKDVNRTNHAYPDGQNIFRFPADTNNEQARMRDLLTMTETRLAKIKQQITDEKTNQSSLSPEGIFALSRLDSHVNASVFFRRGAEPIILVPDIERVLDDIKNSFSSNENGKPLVVNEEQIKCYLPNQKSLPPNGQRLGYELRFTGIGTLQMEAQEVLARTPSGHLIRHLLIQAILPSEEFQIDWYTKPSSDTSYLPVCTALLNLLNDAHSQNANNLSLTLSVGQKPYYSFNLKTQEDDSPDLIPQDDKAIEAIVRALLPPSNSTISASDLSSYRVWVQFDDSYQAEVEITWRQLPDSKKTNISYFFYTPISYPPAPDAWDLGLEKDPKPADQPRMIVLEPGLPAISYKAISELKDDQASQVQSNPISDDVTIDSMCMSILNHREAWESRYKRRGTLTLSQDILVNNDRTIRVALQLDKSAYKIRARLNITPITSLSFDHQGAEKASQDQQPLVQLVSLYRWEFECTEEGNFVSILQNLNGLGGSAEFQLREGLTLNNPSSDTAKATRQYLRAGYTPLPHRLRQASKTISWYRGPLTPRLAQPSDVNTLPLPARNADSLLIYDKVSGMFDASYAAAWELGRTIALADPQFSTQLYHWKRAYGHSIVQQMQYLDHHYLPTQHQLPQILDMPPFLTNWLVRLMQLEGIPFNYLIPTEALLPAESIRFFDLDPLWIECLCDGALSLGRVLQVNSRHDAALRDDSLPNQNEVSGFLLRSKVVAHYPKIEVTGFSLTSACIIELNQSPNWMDNSHVDGMPGITRLSVIRLTRLAPDLMLGLYVGQLDMLELHLPPQILHFGLESPNAVDKIKKLRNPHNGEQIDTETINIDSTFWHNRELNTEWSDPTADSPDSEAYKAILNKQILNFKHLFDTIADPLTSVVGGRPITVGDFALQMLDATPLVRFVRRPSQKEGE